MFPYDKIHKVCFSHLGWLFFPDGRALWSLPRIQVGATFITMTQLTSQPAFGSWTYLLVCHCSLQKGSGFKVRHIRSAIITNCILKKYGWGDREGGRKRFLFVCLGKIRARHLFKYCRQNLKRKQYIWGNINLYIGPVLSLIDAFDIWLGWSFWRLFPKDDVPMSITHFVKYVIFRKKDLFPDIITPRTIWSNIRLERWSIFDSDAMPMFFK